jgi:uncharacterized protein YaiI (UPF0178 family)
MLGMKFCYVLSHAGSAYDSAGIRRYLRRRGIRANIPSNPRNRHKPKRERPIGSMRKAIGA